MTFQFSPYISDEVRDNTVRLFNAWPQKSFGQQPMNEEMSQVIASGGIDIHARNGRGETPLHRMACAGFPDVVDQFIRQGADIEAKNWHQETPLHLAAYCDSVEAIERLLAHGADIGAKEHYQQRPIHLALALHRIQSIEWLLNHGEDLNVRNKDGKTLLRIIADNPKPDTFVWLLNHGANMTVLDSKNTDLAQVACQRPQIKRYFNAFQEAAQPVFDAWQNGSLKAEDLTDEKLMFLLNVWPLEDPHGEVPRFEQLETIFSDGRWKAVEPEHKLDLIQSVPFLSKREQMFLLGGAAARALILREAAAGKEARR